MLGELFFFGIISEIHNKIKVHQKTKEAKDNCYLNSNYDSFWQREYLEKYCIALTVPEAKTMTYRQLYALAKERLHSERGLMWNKNWDHYTPTDDYTYKVDYSLIAKDNCKLTDIDKFNYLIQLGVLCELLLQPNYLLIGLTQIEIFDFFKAYFERACEYKEAQYKKKEFVCTDKEKKILSDLSLRILLDIEDMLHLHTGRCVDYYGNLLKWNDKLDVIRSHLSNTFIPYPDEETMRQIKSNLMSYEQFITDGNNAKQMFCEYLCTLFDKECLPIQNLTFYLDFARFLEDIPPDNLLKKYSDEFTNYCLTHK